MVDESLFIFFEKRAGDEQSRYPKKAESVQFPQRSCPINIADRCIVFNKSRGFRSYYTQHQFIGFCDDELELVELGYNILV